MVSVSVVMITVRPDHPYVGKPDWFIFDPLLKSLEAQTCRDFELIVVDHLLQSRPDSLKGSHGFPVRHIRPKTSIWDELRYPALSNAYNTGLMAAEGELVCIIGDCCELCPDYVRICWDRYKKGELANAIVKFTYQRNDPKRMWGPLDAEHAYGYQCYSRDVLRATNGFDEMFDGAKGHEDTELGVRMGRAGFRMSIPMNLYAVEHEHVPPYDTNRKPCVPGAPYTDQRVNYLNGMEAKDNGLFLQTCKLLTRVRANDGKFPPDKLEAVKRACERTGKITGHFVFYEQMQPKFELVPEPVQVQEKTKPRVLFIASVFCSRALKEYMQLTEAGFDVSLLYDAPNSKLPQYVSNKTIDTLEIDGLKRAIAKYDPQIVHVHNPPSWPVTLLKKFYKGVVVLDIHDLVTGEKDTVDLGTPERIALKSADYVYTVGKNYAELIQSRMKIGRPIYAVESIYWLDNFEHHQKLSRDGSAHLCFIGSMYSAGTASMWCHRFRQVAERQKIHIHIHVNFFHEIVREFASQYMHIEPEIEFMDIPEVLSKYDAGIIPDAHVPDTMPNKLFDYINAGIPCVVEHGRGRLCDLVKQYNIGIVRGIKHLTRKDVDTLKGMDVSPFRDSYRQTYASMLPPYKT